MLLLLLLFLLLLLLLLLSTHSRELGFARESAFVHVLCVHMWYELRARVRPNTRSQNNQNFFQVSKVCLNEEELPPVLRSFVVKTSDTSSSELRTF